jgi:carbohydrate kinase (thermoresistant glucokinase family)
MVSPLFILIMGVTGSGKTTVGRLLSASLGWRFFDADEFHSPANVSKMAAGTALTDEDRGPWLADLRSLLIEHSALGENGVLACSALKAAYRDALTSAGRLAVVYLKADPGLVRARLASRPHHFMPSALIDSQFRDLEEPQSGLTIPAAWPAEEIVRSIRSQLGLTPPAS